MPTVIRHNTYHEYTPPLEYRLRHRTWDENPWTIVIDKLPDYQFVLTNFAVIATAAVLLDVEIGMSITNPLDQFSRKEGLKQAKSRMCQRKVYMRQVQLNDLGEMEVWFETLTGIQFGVKYMPKGAVFLNRQPSKRKLYTDLYGE